MLNPNDGFAGPDPRASMARIGWNSPKAIYRLVQAFLTWATGKALPRQKPLFVLNPWAHLAGQLTLLFGGAAVSIAAWNAGGWYLVALPVTLVATISASRALWLTDLHAAAHGAFSKSTTANRLVGDLVSLPLLVLPHEAYVESHCVRHHGRAFGSEEEDPDASFLAWMGLRPGTPKAELCRRMVFGLLSPRTHAVYLWARFKANLFDGGLVRSVATASYLGCLFFIGSTVGWMALTVAWLAPLTLAYQASSILGWCSEHTWFERPRGDRGAWHARMTHARFFGAAYPVTGGLITRARWVAGMTGHLLMRLLVVPGDLPSHDWHHRRANSSQWTTAAYARQAAIENGEVYPKETWGLKAALDLVMSAISNQPPSNRNDDFPTAVATVLA
jgi:fatty acid desaturase